MSALDEYRKNNGLLKDCETKVEKDEYLFGLGCFVNGWDARYEELAQLRDELEERRKNYIVMCDRLVAEENKNKDLAAKTKAVKAAAVLCEHDFSAQYIGKVCVHCGRAELLPPCD